MRYAVAVAAAACLAAPVPVTAAAAAPAAACTADRLTAVGAERPGGAAQVRFTVRNTSPAACELRGFPTVALAGHGSPDRNAPLAVVRQGTPRPVRLAAGGTASTVLEFTPVLGEADGYCASGADPTVVPTLVVGVPGGGRHQVAPADGGAFALCGASVRATPFR